MPVFSHKQTTALERAVRSIAQDYFERVPLLLSPEEFIAAFIRPEHVPPLKEVEGLVGFVGQSGVVTRVAAEDGTIISATINFHSGKPPIILPNYVGRGMQSEAPDEVKSKIVSWVSSRVRQGFMLGAAIDCIYRLSSVCDSRQAMKLLFPALPAVMAKASGGPDDVWARAARKLSQSNTRCALPALPLEVKEHLRDVSAFLMAASAACDAPVVTTTEKSQAIVAFPGFGTIPNKGANKDALPEWSGIFV